MQTHTSACSLNNLKILQKNVIILYFSTAANLLCSVWMRDMNTLRMYHIPFLDITDQCVCLC